MPELPFIEVLVENLGRQVRGRAITGVRVKSPSILKTYDPPVTAIEGRQIQDVRRVGKLVVLDLSGDLTIIMHLMRDGRLQVVPGRYRGTKQLAFALSLDDGREIRCIELGPKKRAAVSVFRTAEMAGRDPLAGLGVDPLSPAFTPDRFNGMLKAEKGQLKKLLTLQRYVTGIGNAFSDEILWEAKLSPFTSAARLSPAEVARLYNAIRKVLARALREHREHFDDELPMSEPVALLRAHRRGGEPCVRCGTQIAVVYHSEKETYYCPHCQTEDKVYADRRLSRLLK